MNFLRPRGKTPFHLNHKVLTLKSVKLSGGLNFSMDHDKHYLQLFMDVTKAITSNLNTNEVFNLIAKKIPEVIGVDAATIRLLDITGKKLVLHAASGLSEAYLNRGPVFTMSRIRMIKKRFRRISKSLNTCASI